MSELVVMSWPSDLSGVHFLKWSNNIITSSGQEDRTKFRVRREMRWREVRTEHAVLSVEESSEPEVMSFRRQMKVVFHLI